MELVWVGPEEQPGMSWEVPGVMEMPWLCLLGMLSMGCSSRDGGQHGERSWPPSSESEDLVQPLRRPNGLGEVLQRGYFCYQPCSRCPGPLVARYLQRGSAAAAPSPARAPGRCSRAPSPAAAPWQRDEPRGCCYPSSSTQCPHGHLVSRSSFLSSPCKLG